MRCARCGNENSATNRYCGMCGASLAPTPGAASPPAKPPTAAAPASTPFDAGRTSAAPRPAVVSSEAAPVISGPSILGLNQPAAARRRDSPFSVDTRPGARDLHYLLEDDEEPTGRAGKVILTVVVLGLALGFGYLRFRNHTLPWIASHAAKPSAAPEGDEATDSSSAAAAASGSPSGASPGAPPNAAGASASNSPLGTSASASSALAAAANPAASSAPPAATPGGEGASGGPNSSATVQPASVSPGSAPAAAASPPVPAPPPKPRAAADPVSEAQKYLYGKGVGQDCDRGLRLLKPAANQGNPKAMIEMGALYSAGLCTPRDLPTSYRWFALALRKDPNNQSLQADLQKLWGEMTQPERQLAIRLSQ